MISPGITQKEGMGIISFDLDGTLVTDEFSRTVWHQGMPELYAEHYGCGVDRAKELLLGEYDKVSDEALEWYDIQHWLRRFQLNADWQSLLAKFRHYIRTYPEVNEVLHQLSRRYELMITSNAAREFLNTEIEVAGIAPYFKHVVSATSDFRKVKKDRDFYLELCRTFDVSCSDVVHIGDHYRFDYLVPCELGIKSFFLDRSGNRSGMFMVGNLKEFVCRLEA